MAACVGSAGADPRDSWSSSRRIVTTALLIALALGASGCDGGEDVPTALLDGTPAAVSSIAFEGVGVPVVATAAETTAGDENDRAGECLEDWAGRSPRRAAVVRVGVESESVTFRDASGTAVFGCDNSAGPREDDRSWCGGALGKLHDGRLLDPRLDVLCTTEDGDPMAFAWLQPGVRARFVVVAHDSYAEAYEAIGTLPVRVASTIGVDLESSSASFTVTEHDRAGALVRSHTVDARVAG